MRIFEHHNSNHACVCRVWEYIQHIRLSGYFNHIMTIRLSGYLYHMTIRCKVYKMLFVVLMMKHIFENVSSIRGTTYLNINSRKFIP